MFKRNCLYVGEDGDIFQYVHRKSKGVYIFKLYCPVMVCGHMFFESAGFVCLTERDLDEVFGG